MSALRIAAGIYADPYTRAVVLVEPRAPEPRPAHRPWAEHHPKPEARTYADWVAEHREQRAASNRAYRARHIEAIRERDRLRKRRGRVDGA